MQLLVPTKFQYIRMLLRKAWDIESGKWFQTVGGTALSLLGGILCLAASSGNWEIFASQSDRLQITGYGLLVLGAFNFLRCLTAAPYALHCDQIRTFSDSQQESNERAANRASLSLYIDEQRHTRWEGAFSICKVGVRNTCNSCPAKEVALRIHDAKAIGKDDTVTRQNRANEVIGMYLNCTHDTRNIDRSIHSLVDDASFDFACINPPPGIMQILHTTKHGGKHMPELGRLPHGRYAFELRAESINCDVVSLTVELDCDSNGRLVLNTVT